MKFDITKYFKGTPYYKVEKMPWYINYDDNYTRDICVSTIKIPFVKYYIAKRIKNCTGLNEKGDQVIRNIFGKNIVQKGFLLYEYKRNNRIYTVDVNSTMWLLNPNHEYKVTASNVVLYDVKNEQYVGFSHRGYGTFGVGNILFDYKKESVTMYYKSIKYKIKYIFALIKSINDDFNFQDLVEGGIKFIVPFKDRGVKKIENLEEAYTAAKNFAHYLD